MQRRRVFSHHCISLRGTVQSLACSSFHSWCLWECDIWENKAPHPWVSGFIIFIIFIFFSEMYSLIHYMVTAISPPWKTFRLFETNVITLFPPFLSFLSSTLPCSLSNSQLFFFSCSHICVFLNLKYSLLRLYIVICMCKSSGLSFCYWI